MRIYSKHICISFSHILGYYYDPYITQNFSDFHFSQGVIMTLFTLDSTSRIEYMIISKRIIMPLHTDMMMF